MARLDSTASRRDLRLKDLEIGQIFDAISDAMIIVDAETSRILLWNCAAEKIFGYKQAEAIGQNVDILVPDALRSHHRAGIAQYNVTGHGLYIDSQRPFEVPAVHKSGGEIFIEMTLSPVRQATIEGRFVLAVIRDITERKRLHQERMAALEEADRTKDEFLSVISHELRTPLNFIMGFASILKDEVSGPLNAEQHEYTRKILGGTDRMLGLVNNLLDMGRMAAGKFKLEPSLTEYLPIVSEAVELLRETAKEKQIALDADVQVRGEVLVDGRRIIQVISNLIDNAIKFTDPGGSIYVKAFLRDDELITEVRDTGVGIAKEDIPKLFQRFGQLDMSTTRQTTGTGLGLSICKAIVEAHHGRIGVESKPGEGSGFWFSIPVQLPSQQDLDVLVVDDDAETRQVMAVVLKALGHKVTESADGAEALRLCIDEGRHFDIVLMDIVMPNLDGLEVTRLLRARPETQDLPIILVSAKMSAANQEAAKKSGADAFLQKPFKRRDLIEILTRTLVRAGG